MSRHSKVILTELNAAERSAARSLIELALAEDLGNGLPTNTPTAFDLSGLFSVSTVDSILDNVPDVFPSELDRDRTCAALVDPLEIATINVVARRTGVLSGGPIAQLVFERLDSTVEWQTIVPDGSTVAPGNIVAQASGSLRSLLIGERTSLNFLMHLSGVATQTKQFVDAVSGTQATILDTRKTLPGWRRLEKYAVRCGGGTNHRLGLFDGVLIKDNHLAAWSRRTNEHSIADAIRVSRQRSPADVPLEVEVDTLDQLRDALGGQPDIVLLDNMTVTQLIEAVRCRDEIAPQIRLEASGGITLSNVRDIANTGVDRISIGALTHSAPALDLAFDWPT